MIGIKELYFLLAFTRGFIRLEVYIFIPYFPSLRVAFPNSFLSVSLYVKNLHTKFYYLNRSYLKYNEYTINLLPIFFYYKPVIIFNNILDIEMNEK